MFGSSKPDFAGVFDNGFCHVFGDGKGGIGINKEKTMIALADKDKMMTYDLDKVRSHQCVLDSGATIIGGGARGVGMQIGESIRASKATGLFVRVKDIKNPVWRIPIKDEHTQNVWNEILQQWYDGEL